MMMIMIMMIMIMIIIIMIDQYSTNLVNENAMISVQ